MAIQVNAFARMALAAGVVLFANGCHDKPLPILIEKYCVSETGQSKYWLSLNTSEKRGEIRYQYMNQDARYVVKDMQLEVGKISARADFHASSTGETHGNPITFIYDNTTDTLKDGNASAACQNDQGTTQS